jgi:hypothetical protein
MAYRQLLTDHSWTMTQGERRMAQMLDADVMAILTGAAGNMVAYMLNGRADAVRAWFTRIFTAETSENQASSLHQLERDAAAVASSQIGADQLAAKWVAILATHLAQHPEARPDVEALAAATPHPAGTTSVGSVITIGPKVSVGGHNYGSINGPGRQ